MTSHEFARQLLAGPDLPIFTPRVKEYSDGPDEDCCAAPVVSKHDGLTWNDQPIDVLVISYGKTGLSS